MINERSYLFLAILGLITAGPTLAQSDNVYLGAGQVSKLNQAEQEARRLEQQQQRQQNQQSQQTSSSDQQADSQQKSTNENQQQSEDQNNQGYADPKSVFQMADQDRSGTLTKAEYRELAQRQQDAGFDIASSFDDLDTNEDDVLTQTELARQELDVEDDFTWQDLLP